MLIILFGLSGAGKNFIGTLLAEHFGFHFWDADDVLPAEMKEAIAKKQLFTQAMRDELTETMIQHIKNLVAEYPKTVVAQALYKERNREQLRQAFPEALFCWVKADDSIIIQRKTNQPVIVDQDYSKKMSANFELPLLPHTVLLNNGDKESILTKLKKIKI